MGRSTGSFLSACATKLVLFSATCGTGPDTDSITCISVGSAVHLREAPSLTRTASCVWYTLQIELDGISPKHGRSTPMET